MADKPLNYLEPEQLASLIKDAADSDELVIVDVRNEYEFASGHIVGAIHRPSDTWIEEPSTASEVLSGNTSAKKIVVHCFLSQQRGPTCARLLSKALENVELNSPSEKPEIYVLRGGYNEWSKQYGK